MKDAHLVLLKLNRLIDEIGNGSHGFRGTHAAQVNLGTEMQFLVAHGVARLHADKGGGLFALIHLRSLSGFKA